MGNVVSKSPPVLELFSVGPLPYKHVVITGASSGIGAAVAVKLSTTPGINLTLIARNPARLEAVQTACRLQGAEVHSFTLDVTDKQAIAEAMILANKLSPIDLVIANAGIVAATPTAIDVISTTSSGVGDMLWNAANTNIMGTLHTVAPALPLLKATAAGGRPAAVAVVSSVSVLPPKAVQFTGKLQLGLLPYAWSKQALLSLSQGLQAELKGSGVSVYTICPGVVLTGLATHLAESLASTPTAATPSAAACSPDSGSHVGSVPVAAGHAHTYAHDGGNTKAAGAAEQQLRQKLGAINAEEAAQYVCAGLATGKGGLIAFPPAAVRTMKFMELLPQSILVKWVKKGMAKYTARQSCTL